VPAAQPGHLPAQHKILLKHVQNYLNLWLPIKLMQKYFTKLDIDLDQFNLDSELEQDTFRLFKYSTYFDLKNHSRYEYLKEVFDFLQPDRIVYAQHGRARPHRDADGILCAINQYYITQDATTIYYEPKPSATPFVGSEYETVPNFYEPQDIVEQKRFKSNVNDTYLLNVNEIHSLDFPDQQHGYRTMIKWQFKVPYKDVYNELAKRGLINV
jgi:hypothetical protein